MFGEAGIADVAVAEKFTIKLAVIINQGVSIPQEVFNVDKTSFY